MYYTRLVQPGGKGRFPPGQKIPSEISVSLKCHSPQVPWHRGLAQSFTIPRWDCFPWESSPPSSAFPGTNDAWGKRKPALSVILLLKKSIAVTWRLGGALKGKRCRRRSQAGWGTGGRQLGCWVDFSLERLPLDGEGKAGGIGSRGMRVTVSLFI